MIRVMFLAAAFGILSSQPILARNITSAKFAEETTRYDHGILGDAVEYGALILTVDGGQSVRIVLPKSRVFEDITPRLVDVDLDGDSEVMVVETSLTKGARLSIYDEKGLVAATPHIGRPHRWLAPVGAADLDGDGVVEIAYVDRPHLARLLKIWQFREGKLVFVARKSGLTNHRIGDDYISGGLRDCGNGIELITTDSGWSTLMASRFAGRKIITRELGRLTGQRSFQRALACKI